MQVFKPNLILIALIGIILFSTYLFAAPPEEQEITLEGDVGSYFLPELGAVILIQDAKLKIEFIMPPEQRTEEYKTVDLKQGDLILMANGKKMTSAEDIQKMHDAVEIGDMIKLGIKRDKSMMMVSFKKADPKDLPMTEMMIVQQDDGGAFDESVTSSSGSKTIMKTFAGPDDILLMAEVGLLFMKENDQFVLNSITHDLAENLSGTTPAPGDVLKSIQGKTFSTLKECRDIYEKTAVGDKIEIVFNHDSKEMSASFTKEKARPMKMIQKTN